MAIKKIDSFNKHQNPSTNQNPFDIENYLNVNWNKAQDVINNNADELKTAQNNISEIKQEQITQNTDIENIKKSNEEKAKEIASLKTELENEKSKFENYAIHGKESGEYIHLTDSSETDCKVDVRGNSRQETSTQGKNRIDLREATYKVSDVNVTKKGSTLTLNGIMNAPGNLLNTVGDKYNFIYFGKFKAGTYRFSRFIVSGKYSVDNNIGPGTFACYIKKKDETTLGTILENASSGDGRNIILQEDTDLYMQIFCNKGAIFDNYALGFQLEEGDKTTDFEQFTPNMPSLDYPSKIETVKGSVKVTSCNKNLFINTAKNVTRGGIDFIVNEDGSAVANGTSTGTFLDLGEILLKPGTYIFSGGPQNGESNKQRLSIYNIDNGSNILLSALWGKNTYTTTFKEETKVKLTYVVQAGVTLKDEIVKPQIEKGTTATEYQVHKEDSVVLSIQEEMLEGDCFVKETDGWKEVHGFGYINTRGDNEISVSKTSDSTNDFFRYNVYWHKAKDRKIGVSLNIFCTHFKYGDSRWVKNEAICGWETGKSFCVGTFNTKLDTTEKIKTFFKENDVEIYYELETPIKLPCTQEQIQALEKLDKLKTYKNITNITTDSIAILDVDYKKDLETWQNQQDDRIKALEELVSTTQTSAMLIENLENDLLKEV